MNHFEYYEEQKRIFQNVAQYSDEEAVRLGKAGWKKIIARSFMDDAIYLYSILNGKQVDGSRYWIDNPIKNARDYGGEVNLQKMHDEAYKEALTRCLDQAEADNLLEYYLVATQQK